MKKIIITICAVFALYSSLNAQVMEFTDIQINTERVIVKSEPLPKFFASGGVLLCSPVEGWGASVGGWAKVGWYQIHGFYAGFSSRKAKQELDFDKLYPKYPDTDMKKEFTKRFSLTAGYVYNFPFSRSGDGDIMNLLQLMMGVGYGKFSDFTGYESQYRGYTYNGYKDAPGFVLEPGVMLRLGPVHFSFGLNLILGKQACVSGQFGMGFNITTGKSKAKTTDK